MADTGWKSPGTVVNDDTVGTVAWSNPKNVKVSDNIYSTADVTTIPRYSYYLKATNFGFSIPSGATINGIEVRRERKASGDSDVEYVIENEVRIVKADGSIGTTNKADTVSRMTVTEGYKSYGGGSDLWGETWSVGDINDSDFGVVFSDYLYYNFEPCLEGNTLIQTNKGKVRIKDIKIGDKILSYNGNIAEFKRVKKVFRYLLKDTDERVFRVSCKNRRCLVATGNHRVYVQGKYIRVEELKVGERLLLTNMGETSVTKVEIIDNKIEEVWDLEVEDNQNFFANGFLVHNTTSYIDHIQIKVYYTEGGTGASSERGLYTKGGKHYSKESSTSLKTNDTNLATSFTEQEYSDVATDNDTYVNLIGTQEYFQFLFKEPNDNSTDDFRITWKGKSTLAPSSHTVYLQIYNRTTSSWTNLTSNNSASANTKFTLTYDVTTGMSDYYDANHVISARVYQDVVV